MEMYESLVVRYGIMTHREFMDATPFEVMVASDTVMSAHRDEWEMARLISMSCLAPHSKRKVSPTDVIRFPWEKEGSREQSEADAMRSKVMFNNMQRRTNGSIQQGPHREDDAQLDGVRQGNQQCEEEG